MLFSVLYIFITAWISDIAQASQEYSKLSPKQHSRLKRQLDGHAIPFAHSTGLVDSPESRTIAAAVCKAHCLKDCVDTLKQKAITDATMDEVLKALYNVPTQLRTECIRLSPGFLYYEECEQACEADKPYNECVQMCETGDSPGGWSCLTGCRVLDAALKERSGECPPQGGPAIHRLPGLMEHPGEWLPPKERTTNTKPAGSKFQTAWYPSVHQIVNDVAVQTCTVDAECPNKKDKCCHSRCRRAVFREDILPPIPSVRILESKSPPSFVLSWDPPESNSVRNNLSNPTVYVLQVKTYFGPDFDSRLSNAWRTLVMSTLTGAQLSEPRIGWWYQFQVASANRWGSLGFDIPSPPVQLTNLKPQAPSSPRDLRDGLLTLQADREIQLQIHWSPPTVTTIPVTEYRISWGPDAPTTPDEPDFSGKPTEFIHTVPASTTSFVLTNLVSDALYRVQVIAMCAWGTTQLRSRPSVIFIRTPTVAHLEAHQTPSDVHLFDNQFTDMDGFSGSFSARVKSSKDYRGERGQCICDGQSKSMVLREPSITMNDSQQTSRLELTTDPAIFDGRQIRMRLQLVEHSATSLTSGPVLLHLRWTAQVCIESKGVTEPRLSSLSPDTDAISSGNLLGSKSTEEVLLKPGFTAVQLQPVSKNQTFHRYGEAMLTYLWLNCRYLLEVFKVSKGLSTASVEKEQPKELLRACICTPTCSSLLLSPWVPKLDCQRAATVRLPPPRSLKYHLVQSVPLTYNITWLPGTEDDEPNSKWPTAVAKSNPDKHNALLQNDPEFSQNEKRTADQKPMHYRIIWGPSQDKSITPTLWTLWPGLHPRLDPTNAEAKVLRNGETSLLLSPLSPGTQYVVKVQTMHPSTTVSTDFNIRYATDPNRMAMRSASSSIPPSLPQVSKEVYLYFETPSLPSSEPLSNKPSRDSVNVRKLSGSSSHSGSSSNLILWTYSLVFNPFILHYIS